MRRAFLAKLQSAGAMPPDEHALLLQLCDRLQSVPAHSDIIRDGERPDEVHLMMEGWACRYKLLEDGSRQITAFMLPGDFCDTHITIFAEMDHGIATLTPRRVVITDMAALKAMAGFDATCLHLRPPLA